MNWDDVRVFLSVARTGQLLSASRRLGMNHATVGRRLSALEEALGTRLVNRRPSGCELTSEGEAFLPAAERMETELIAAQSAIGRQNDQLSGTVRIGAPDGFGVAFLAPRLGQLMDAHPALTIQLVPVPRAFSLSRREADLAVTVERPSEGRLVSRKLTDYTLGLYASRTYAGRHGIPAAPDDLRDHRLVGYVDDLIFSPELDFSREFLRAWDNALEISSATGQAQAVRAGAGIGILHDYIARDDPDLVPVLPGLAATRTYWVAYHESVRDLARVRTVLEFITAAVAQSGTQFCR